MNPVELCGYPIVAFLAGELILRLATGISSMGIARLMGDENPQFRTFGLTSTIGMLVKASIDVVNEFR